LASEEDLFVILYNRFHREVYAYCRRRVNAEAVDDAVAETFLTAWRKWSQVPPIEEALPWLYGVAYRVLLHHWRSTSRRKRLTEKLTSLGAPPENLPEDLIVFRTESRQILGAIERLKHTDQEILRLTAWEQLSQAEIAAVLGISLGAVRQRFYQAKKNLAHEYNRLETRRTATPAARNGGVK